MGISADRDGRDILGRSWAILLTLFRIRYWMISNIPLSLRIGITSGIGLFIALMGLKILALLSPIKTPVMIGDLSSHGVLLGILGFYYNRVVITSFSCRGACFYCGDVLLWIIFR